MKTLLNSEVAGFSIGRGMPSQTLQCSAHSDSSVSPFQTAHLPVASKHVQLVRQVHTSQISGHRLALCALLENFLPNQSRLEQTHARHARLAPIRQSLVYQVQIRAKLACPGLSLYLEPLRAHCVRQGPSLLLSEQTLPRCVFHAMLAHTLPHKEQAVKLRAKGAKMDSFRTQALQDVQCASLERILFKFSVSTQLLSVSRAKLVSSQRSQQQAVLLHACSA